jgi:hypothetical protein
MSGKTQQPDGPATASIVCSVPGADLRHARVADYNGDGFSDILWEDDTGNLKAWFMQGTTVAKTQTFGNIGLK